VGHARRRARGSAGVFVVMAGDVAAMSPGTNIGAATPVNLQGRNGFHAGAQGHQRRGRLRAHDRSPARAQRRWAESAVREAVAVSETEAVSSTSSTSSPLASTSCSPRPTVASGAAERRSAPCDRRTADRSHRAGFRQRLLALIADPNVAYILMMLGFYGMLFELQNPARSCPGRGRRSA
jgi:membrane-bound serine protease (ClpP class)